MRKNKVYTLNDHLKESLKDPLFRIEWEKSEAEYQLANKLIKLRLKNKYSQSQLAAKANTTQAVISRIESMNANPSLFLLKKLAGVFGSKVQISFV